MTKLAGAVLCALLLPGCRRPDASLVPLIRLTSRDYAFSAPSEIPAGVVHLRLVNEGPDIHEAMIVRFDGPGSAATYVDAVRGGDDFPAFAIDLGGAGLASAGDSTDIYLKLEPGRYAVVCWKGDHLQRGMAHDLVVREAVPSIARAPREDVTIIMREYGFEMPATIAPGPHIIKVTNRGAQPHEMDIVQLRPGKTMRDYTDWLDHDEEGPPPLKVIGGTGDFWSGREVWIPVMLPAGKFFLLCQVPDAGNGKPHYQLGMTREFEVK
ncbi:MAG: hypothetical protein ABI613_08225 [Gemmatimonadota bacterium]